ncbi:sodium-dependent transporter [Sulfurospirillum sp. 1612]|uniref:sodium-dependent transporter n=1 Tax=Sulfurospirillum sp. 1612 TaxID=3094835 RepID=UPI002F94D232
MEKARFSRVGFILAAAGSAVGLGNIWKFPYMAGQNGGGAFVLIYLLTVVLIGLSIFIAEVYMGRTTREDGVTAFETLAARNGHIWKYAGFMVFTGVLILSFYTIVIGWIFKYIILSFSTLPISVGAAGKLFGAMVSGDWEGQFAFFNIAFFLTMWIVARGVKRGIERVNLILMPLLILILIFLFFYSMTYTGFEKSLTFLFYPEWDKLTQSSLLQAVGHAFFTLSLGMGTIMTYATSLPKGENIVKSSFYVAFIDTLIALVAGIIIFTFVFHFGEKPSQGPGLVFISLPALFHHMGVMGNVISLLFFVALAFAGITSAVSIVEPTALFFINRFKMARSKALIIIAVIVYILGTMAVLSNTKAYGAHFTYFGKGAFDLMDFVSAAILLPLGGMIIAIFVGFVIERDKVHATMSKYMSDRLFNLWYFSIRYIAPAAVMIVMINKLFF